MSLLRPPPALSSPLTATGPSTQFVGLCLSTSRNPVLSLTNRGGLTQSLNLLSFSFLIGSIGGYSDLHSSGCYEDYIRAWVFYKMPSIVPHIKQVPRKWSYEDKDAGATPCALGWGTGDLSSLDPDLKCLKRVSW